jgi:hypothetical protein
MASSGKRKTTMAKLTRESRLRERRLDKQARKDARKYAAAHPGEPTQTLTGDDGMPDSPDSPDSPDAGQPVLEADPPPVADA